MTRILKIALLTLGDPGRLTGGYLYHQRIADLAPHHGAHITFASFPESLFPLPALAAPRVLREAMAADAGAFILDSIAAAYVGPWALVRSPAVPLIGMLHQPPGGIDHGPIRAAVQASLDQLAYRRARLLMVASDALADQLVRDGTPRERLRVVPPGRDVAPAPGPWPGDLRCGRQAAFLCVGNWIERKGIHDLLDAFSRLPPDMATLHLVGDDRADPLYAARLRRRLAQPDLSGRVVVHGPVSIGAVAALYAAADSFVLPSLKEPYGTVYGEAMAAGLPVVGWCAGNLPYLVEDGQEGFVLPPGDIQALAGSLALLAEDEHLRHRLGEAARVRALTRPTWEQTAALFFAAVREALME